jgi:hypothetical protein
MSLGLALILLGIMCHLKTIISVHVSTMLKQKSMDRSAAADLLAVGQRTEAFPTSTTAK